MLVEGHDGERADLESLRVDCEQSGTAGFSNEDVMAEVAEVFGRQGGRPAERRARSRRSGGGGPEGSAFSAKKRTEFSQKIRE